MKKLLFFTFIIISSYGFSQIAFLPQHEVGANIGLGNFQGDFRPKGALDGLVQVNSFTTNLVHTFHVIPRRYNSSILFQHAMIKTTLSYTHANFNNKGYGDPNQDLQAWMLAYYTQKGQGGTPVNDYDYSKIPSDVLSAKLTSSSNIFSLNSQVEFYLSNLINTLHRYNKFKRTQIANPYIGIGAGVASVSASTKYSQDAIDKNAGDNGYPDGYDATTIASFSGLSLMGNIALGSRFKINREFDFNIELNNIFYFNDKVDSVNPKASANEWNDYTTNITAGVIYHLY